MLSISTGHDVGYLTDQVAGGREGYYTGATVDHGEPAGQWYGAGAAALGLSGEVDADLMEAIYLNRLDPRDLNTHDRSTWGLAETMGGKRRTYQTPDQLYASYLAQEPDVGPERREELRAAAERNARQSVEFIDVTHSVQKSITLLGVAFERAANDARAAGDEAAAAEWDRRRAIVEEAAMVGARASIDYLQKHAGFSRVGKHGGGAGRWTDAHEWTVAQFLQHDSRNHDPQLHVHQAILNRVLCRDGKWRTLDGQAIYKLRGAASAIAERATEAFLTEKLGIRFELREDGTAREVAGVPKASSTCFPPEPDK